MLHESYPWKAELKRLKLQLVRISRSPLSENVAEFKIEKPLLYSAVVVRKLLESWKITDATRNKKYRVKSFPSKPGRHNVLVRLTMQGDIDKEFVLTAPKADSMDAWSITSELLHSGFLNWEVNRRHCLVGILVASKRNQATRLLRLRMADYLRLLDSIISDQPSKRRTSVDSNGRLAIQIS